MKRIYASLGVAAVSVAAVQSVHAQSADPSKSWSVAASLRGFYDDNVNTATSGKVDSFGFEVSPTIAYNLPLENTDLGLSYTYAYKYYEKKFSNRDDHDDETHTFAARLRHAFSERLVMTVQDSFVIGQEPDVLRSGDAYVSLQRISGDNIRNFGAITFNGQVTEVFGLEAGYRNSLFDYDDETAGGNSALLDRLDHAAHIDGRWNLRENTVGLVGYEFGWVDYTADDVINPGDPVLYKSDDRNLRTHKAYVGVEHTFQPQLTGSLRVGASYGDYYNSPNSEDNIAPFARANLAYTYAPESHLDFGASHDRSATDLFSVEGNDITVDSEATVVYVSVTHRIVPKLFGSVIGTYQYSTFNGGQYDDDSENLYVIGVNLRYNISRHLSADAGYNYDNQDGKKSLGRDFDRNRVYLGATFVY